MIYLLTEQANMKFAVQSSDYKNWWFCFCGGKINTEKNSDLFKWKSINILIAVNLNHELSWANGKQFVTVTPRVLLYHKCDLTTDSASFLLRLTDILFPACLVTKTRPEYHWKTWLHQNYAGEHRSHTNTHKQTNKNMKHRIVFRFFHWFFHLFIVCFDWINICLFTQIGRFDHYFCRRHMSASDSARTSTTTSVCRSDELYGEQPNWTTTIIRLLDRNILLILVSLNQC